MRYLILLTVDGKQEAFYTQWFTPENFDKEKEMLVFDLVKGKFTTDGVTWKKITEDHL